MKNEQFGVLYDLEWTELWGIYYGHDSLMKIVMEGDIIGHFWMEILRVNYMKQIIIDMCEDSYT